MKKRRFIDRPYALSIAHTLRDRLEKRSIPVREVLIFGSAAREDTHDWSDIDIAVICNAFLPSKFDEQHVCSREARSIDVRAEVVCFRPRDFDNKYFTLAQEVRRHGITVGAT